MSFPAATAQPGRSPSEQVPGSLRQMRCRVRPAAGKSGKVAGRRKALNSRKVGGGVQRARLTDIATGNRETSYSPLFQGLVGIKFFLIKQIAIFGEAKYTQGWHSFDYAGVGFPPDYRERYTIVTGNVVGGVALHF